MPKPAVLVVMAAPMLVGCSTTPAINEISGRGELVGADGKVAGITELIRSGESLALRIMASGFEPGTRALHLHQQGKCEGPAFTSAGGHLNPFGRTHGKLSESGKHLGDLPNLEVPASGQIEVTFEIDGKATEVLPLVFDTDGTAVMIHAGPDDYRTDPTGGAGARIACAILQPVN